MSDAPADIDLDALLEASDAPETHAVVELDVRTLGPPKPLRKTLEASADLADEEVLVQYNDRTPQHLYPKLDDRGLTYETVESEDVTVTLVWNGDD
ncbi:DUF2249 domain-containing protein [Halorhabdus sp. CBA1104]|uniref:DUF2249 domain-containing protein n=1 Tax=unclassified Halorhabdus TaxID=2621901 RepID=UPI0012B27F15|nr:MULTISPECIES: DUF2249 domain-containing protein [unclassified Halorhabdus]QGN07467.1 DUF2249 domain-containing protein [Halorhabdus sp. CBA1104]